jgi:hypothetical protein
LNRPCRLAASDAHDDRVVQVCDGIQTHALVPLGEAFKSSTSAIRVAWQ